MKRMKLLMLACLIFTTNAHATALDYHLEPALVKGPDACAECHESTTEIWKKTHHSRTFKELPRREKATEISQKLGVKRIKTAAECSGCHFTAVLEENKSKAIAGISCESCHGAARDWIDVHSDFGGRDVEAADETEEHKFARYQKSEAAGMIRPNNVEGLIRNCYSCHMINDESLINDGGHPSASAFEIVRWSQGEVRHNVWYSDDNTEASPERKRILFMVGQVLNYEYALRALAGATSNGDFAKAVARQAKLSQKRLSKLNTMVETKEVTAVLAIAAQTKLALNQSESLLAAADKVSAQVAGLANDYDGTSWSALDKVIPPASKFKGTVSQ